MKGDWDYELEPVYTIAILDFIIDEDKSKFLHQVMLKDINDNEIFYDKFTLIFLEAPKFKKDLDQLETQFDKWLYLINNLSILERIPDKLRDKLFEKVFSTAEISKMDDKQLMEYEESLKEYRDLKNSIDTATEAGRKIGLQVGKELGIKEGKEIGVEIGKEMGVEIGKEMGIKEGAAIEKREMALKFKSMGVDSKTISEGTGLTIEEIEKL